MTPKQLEYHLHKRLTALFKKAAQKQQEYARNNDAHHAFKRQADMRKHKVIDVMVTDWSKQLVSLMDIANDFEAGNIKNITNALVEEKSGDNIIYSIIFETIVADELRKHGR